VSDARILCWFSCGIPSALSAKMALTMFKDSEVLIMSCDTRPSEHEDNYRFSAECERWFGRPITFIRNEDYAPDATVDDIFERKRYMSGPDGARCTVELKKIPRFRFQRPDDIHIIGYTAEEGIRIKRFNENNHDIRTYFILKEFNITRGMAYKRFAESGIRPPVMYELGFDNNNCPGCVKASSPWYWAMTRRHFPEVFERRCAQSRELGVRLVEIQHHKRIFLDELPDIEFEYHGGKEKLSCGPECSPPTAAPKARDEL
jgi:hypothetical protein